MRLASLEVFCFPMPFRTVFRHAAASRSRTDNLIVAAHSACGLTGYGEGCPRAYVSGETIASGLAFIERHRESLTRNIHDVPSLKAWMVHHRTAIDHNPAAFCAVELAILDVIGQASRCPVEDLVGVPRLDGAFRYSAVVGDAPYPAYRWQFYRYRKLGAHDFKIKLSGDLKRDRRKLGVFRNAPEGLLRVRLDANNLWDSPEACIAHIRALRHRCFAIEEPLRAGDLGGFARVGEACATGVILDESLLRPEQMDALGSGDGWLVNIRVSKMGGLIRALTVAAAARKRGIGIIVGAQVGETSLLTRAGLALMSGVGQELVAAEGAFGTYLLREDLTSPCLMFGSGGVLRAQEAAGDGRWGLGLSVRRDALVAARTRLGSDAVQGRV